MAWLRTRRARISDACSCQRFCPDLATKSPLNVRPLATNRFICFLVVHYLGLASYLSGLRPQAAAKRLWTLVQREPVLKKAKYFLVVMKCASHQASLATKVAAVGPAAIIGCGGPDQARTGAPSRFCGVAARLYKFLLADYWEEYAEATSEWVASTLRVVSEPHDVPPPCATGAHMQPLYTARILSNDLLKILNGPNGVLEPRCGTRHFG